MFFQPVETTYTLFFLHKVMWIYVNRCYPKPEITYLNIFWYPLNKWCNIRIQQLVSIWIINCSSINSAAALIPDVGSLGRACVLVIYCKSDIRNKPWLMMGVKLESLNTVCCCDSIKDDFYLSTHFQTDPGSLTLPKPTKTNRVALCGGTNPQYVSFASVGLTAERGRSLA